MSVVLDFWKSLEDSRFLMVSRTHGDAHAMPMTAMLDESAHGAIWFFTSKDSRLAAGGQAMAQYISKRQDIFACMNGQLTEENDVKILDKHWSNQVSAWYEGGRDDPNLLFLRFDLESIEVWEPDLSLVDAFKMKAGGKIDKSKAGAHIEKIF